MPEFYVDADIRRATTLPASIYTDPAIFESELERVLARTWQFAGDAERIKAPGQVAPFTLLPGSLDEPLLLTRDLDDGIHCLSNVCTHRGNLVVDRPGTARKLRCRYHGRCFSLNGAFEHMPEFEGVENFPSDADNLPAVRIGAWPPFLFVSLDPAHSFDELVAPVRERVGWLPVSDLTLDAARSRDYLVRANWALYVENYLDALHVPFVHPELSGALNYTAYAMQTYSYANLQLGATRGGEEVFAAPPGSADYGAQITAYYFWLFPNTMLNFYPWGVSVNVVRPLGVDRTRVSFLRYAWPRTGSPAGMCADDAVDRVEREDEAIVESVQLGVRSRYYDRGRYSPTREVGTHQFHRLLAGSLSEVRTGDHLPARARDGRAPA